MLPFLNPPSSGICQIQTMKTFGEPARTWRIAADVYLRTSQLATIQEKRMGEAGNSRTKQQQRTKTVQDERDEASKEERVWVMFTDHPLLPRNSLQFIRTPTTSSSSAQ